MPRKMASHCDWSVGRWSRLRNIPLEVPPRKKVAGMGFATAAREEERLAARKTLGTGNGGCKRYRNAIT